MFYIYAIASIEKNYIYVGLTKNINDRVLRHNKGRERTTRAYRPFELIFTETVNGSRSDARKREKYWKSGVGKEQLRIIRNKHKLPK